MGQYFSVCLPNLSSQYSIIFYMYDANCNLFGCSIADATGPHTHKSTNPQVHVYRRTKEKTAKADAATESIKSQRDALERLCLKCISQIPMKKRGLPSGPCSVTRHPDLSGAQRRMSRWRRPTSRPGDHWERIDSFCKAEYCQRCHVQRTITRQNLIYTLIDIISDMIYIYDICIYIPRCINWTGLQTYNYS